MVAGIVAVYPYMRIVNNLEAPRLGVVTAGRPAGEVKNVGQVHAGVLTILAISRGMRRLSRQRLRQLASGGPKRDTLI
jgi:hypothetical protein